MSLFEQASICVTPNGYKAGKLYSIKPTNGAGDLDVVRATGATRVNASGLIETVANNVPRLDYPPLGGCPSILVEPQRTNLLTYSEQFNNAIWNKVNSGAGTSPVVTANAGVAPDGTMTADRVQFSTGGSLVTDRSILRKILTLTAVSHNLSLFIKSNTGAGEQSLAFTFKSNAVNVFTVTELEWTRVDMTDTALATIASYGIEANGLLTDSDVDVLIWGAQLEEGSYATSYIPTVASAVTRNADLISKTGISDLIGQTEGVLFVDFIAETPSEIRRISLSQNASNRILITHQSNGRIQFFGNESAITQFTFITSEVYTKGDRVKVALAYKQNDFAGYVNGVQMFTDNSGDIPALLPNFNFSDPTIGQTPLIGSVNQALLFKTRLSNETLEQLTTL